MQLLKFVNQHGLEGVIAKRSDSVYEPGKRSGLWRLPAGSMDGSTPARNVNRDPDSSRFALELAAERFLDVLPRGVIVLSELCQRIAGLESVGDYCCRNGTAR